MKTKPKSGSMQEAPHDEFRRRVLSLDRRHVAAASIGDAAGWHAERALDSPMNCASVTSFDCTDSG